MFAMDVPYIPAMEETPVLVAQAEGSVTPTADYIVSMCTETEDRKGLNDALSTVSPVSMLKHYLWDHMSKRVEAEDVEIDLIQGVQHGNLDVRIANDGHKFYKYHPDTGFLGDDRAIFLVKYEGKHYKIILDIKVLYIVDEYVSECPDPVMIEAPKPSKGGTDNHTGFNLDLSNVTFSDLEAGR